MIIKIIPQDKANHAIYGAIIALLSLLITILFYPVPLAAAMSLGTTVIIGILKEVLDKIANYQAGRAVHGVEFMDFLATALGGVVVYLAAILPNLITG